MEIYGTKDNLEKAGRMMAEVERLLEVVGVAVHGRSTECEDTPNEIEQKPSKWVPTRRFPALIKYRAFPGKRQGV
jgi:hypothetical protein